MLSRSGFHFTLANLPNKNGLQLDFSECAKPLSYSTERISEPSPPSWENLQEDLRSCSVVDPLFRNLNQGESSFGVTETDDNQTAVAEFSSPVFARHIEDPVALAQITVEVRVAARDLAILKEDAKQRHKKFKESLEVLKEDLEDLT